MFDIDTNQLKIETTPSFETVNNADFSLMLNIWVPQNLIHSYD